MAFWNKKGAPAPDGAAPITNDRSSYYEGGRTWESHVARQNAASRAIAWLVATISLLIAAGSVAALVLLLPLKSYEPYVVEVDRNSGFLEVKRALQPGAMTQNEAVTMANIVRYLRARETYDPKNLINDFNLAQLLSTGKASEDLTKFFAQTNPENPVNILGRNGNISVQIKALSFPNPNTALVRFSTTVKRPTSETTRHWQGLIRFRYTSTPTTNEFKFDNPLGFQVTEYRRDQETVRADVNSNASNLPLEPSVIEQAQPATTVVAPPPVEAPPAVPLVQQNNGVVANPPPPPLPEAQ